DDVAAFGDAAGVGMLDDNASGGARRIELGDAFISRIGVVDVVVGQFAALHLPRGRDARTLVRRRVKRRYLVRVLAVAQRLDQVAAEGAEIRRLQLEFFCKPVRDRGVIGGGAGIGLGGETAAQAKRGSAI